MRIGRKVRVLKDKNREEIFNSSNENRRVVISIFYPVDDNWNAYKQALYKDLYSPQEERFLKEWAESEEEKSYINNLTTNVYIDAPIIKNNEKYPVILYSPAFTCDRDSSIFNIEKLVEEGYIVITLGSLYETDFTVMPNGEIIGMSEKLDGLSSDSKEIWQQLVDIRKKDIIFVLDELNYINNYDNDFKGKLDIEKVGVIGFSLGSQGAFEAAADDKRIKAVALFEGCLHYSKVLDRVKEGERTGTPHLLIKRHASSHRLRVDECYSWYENMEDREKAEKLVKNQIETACKITETQEALYEYINGFKSFVKINYSQHMTFCDMPILSNEEYAECLGGKITIKRAHEIINKTTISFFNEFLKGNFNEYQDFVEKENGYSELVEIDGAGEIKLY